MALTTKSVNRPNFAGMTQAQIDAYWARQPKVRIRVHRPFQMLTKAYDDAGTCTGIRERYTVPPGTVLEVDPVLAGELCDVGSKAERVDESVPLTKRQPGEDPYDWNGYCAKLAAERAKAPMTHGTVLAALTAAVNAAQAAK